MTADDRRPAPESLRCGYFAACEQDANHDGPHTAGMYPEWTVPSQERDLLRHVLEGAIGATPTGQTDGFTHVFIPSEQEAPPAPAPQPEPLRAALDDDPDGEHCNECGQPVWVWWHAPDDLWASVTGREDGGGLRCIRCFDRAATEQGHLIEWRPIVHDRAALQASPPTAQPESPEMRHERGGYDPTLSFICHPGWGAHHHDCAVCDAYFLKESGAVPASGEGHE